MEAARTEWNSCASGRVGNPVLGDMSVWEHGALSRLRVRLGPGAWLRRMLDARRRTRPGADNHASVCAHSDHPRTACVMVC